MIELGFISCILLGTNLRFLFCIHKQLSQNAFEWSIHSYTFVSLRVESYFWAYFHFYLLHLSIVKLILDNLKYFCFIMCLSSFSSLNLSLRFFALCQLQWKSLEGLGCVYIWCVNYFGENLRLWYRVFQFGVLCFPLTLGLLFILSVIFCGSLCKKIIRFCPRHPYILVSIVNEVFSLLF